MSHVVQWKRQVVKLAKLAGFVLALPLLLIFVLLAIAGFLIWRLSLLAMVWTLWCPRGRDILFVYSNSPLWQSHLEDVILPHIRDRAVVLNWSERKQWRLSLAVLAFYHFGGSEEYNPLAVVFRPLRGSRTFRFWAPFQDLKRGNPGPLAELESAFFESLGIAMSGADMQVDASTGQS